MRKMIMGLAGALAMMAVPAASQNSSGAKPWERAPMIKLQKTIWLSGNDLYARCTKDINAPQGVADYGFCRGYIYGAVDALLTRSAEAKGKACFADGVTNTQLVDVVIAYLRDNPAKRHEPADFAVAWGVVPLLAYCPTNQ